MSKAKCVCNFIAFYPCKDGPRGPGLSSTLVAAQLTALKMFSVKKKMFLGKKEPTLKEEPICIPTPTGECLFPHRLASRTYTCLRAPCLCPVLSCLPACLSSSHAGTSVSAWWGSTPQEVSPALFCFRFSVFQFSMCPLLVFHFNHFLSGIFTSFGGDQNSV